MLPSSTYAPFIVISPAATSISSVVTAVVLFDLLDEETPLTTTVLSLRGAFEPVSLNFTVIVPGTVVFIFITFP